MDEGSNRLSVGALAFFKSFKLKTTGMIYIDYVHKQLKNMDKRGQGLLTIFVWDSI